MYKRIDLTQLQGFPLDQDAIEFMQKSFRDTFAGLAPFLGDYVYISGVDDLGASYGNGWVVINGEILPFVGGLKAAQVVIEQTVVAVQFADGVNRNTEYTRVAKSGSTGGTNHSSFTRLLTVKQVSNDLPTKAPSASPALTGTPTVPTAAPGTNTAQIANTAFVKAAIDALLAGVPGALDTLNELATALGNDANFSATVTAAIGAKVSKSGDTMAGNLTVPNGSSSGHAVNKGQLDLKANKAQAAWIAMSFNSPWTEQNYAARYRIDEFGMVHLKGDMWTNGTSLTVFNYVAFNLPVGYRPVQRHSFAVDFFNGSARALGWITVETSGDVVFQTTGTIANSVPLDSIRFFID